MCQTKDPIMCTSVKREIYYISTFFKIYFEYEVLRVCHRHHQLLPGMEEKYCV